MKAIITSILLFVMILGGFIFWRVIQGDTSQKEIKIACNPWAPFENLYLAEKMGFFKAEGLNVRLFQFGTLEDCRLAMELGQMNGMCSTLTEVLQVFANVQKHLKVGLLVDFSKGADVILAKKPIVSVKELKGKKIAVERMTLGMYVLSRALENAGLTLSDVQILTFNLQDMGLAINNGIVDAAVTYPPFSIAVDQMTDVDPIFDSKEIPEEIMDVISFDPSVLESEPDLVSKFRRVWAKTLLYIEKHKVEAHAFMAERESITIPEFEASLSALQVFFSDDQARLMKKSGVLENTLSKVAKVLIDSGDLNIQSIGDPKTFIPEVKDEK